MLDEERVHLPGVLLVDGCMGHKLISIRLLLAHCQLNLGMDGADDLRGQGAVDGDVLGNVLARPRRTLYGQPVAGIRGHLIVAKAVQSGIGLPRSSIDHELHADSDCAGRNRIQQQDLVQRNIGILHCDGCHKRTADCCPNVNILIVKEQIGGIDAKGGDVAARGHDAGNGVNGVGSIALEDGFEEVGKPLRRKSAREGSEVLDCLFVSVGRILRLLGIAEGVNVADRGDLAGNLSRPGANAHVNAVHVADTGLAAERRHGGNTRRAVGNRLDLGFLDFFEQNALAQDVVFQFWPNVLLLGCKSLCCICDSHNNHLFLRLIAIAYPFSPLEGLRGLGWPAGP